MKIEGNNKRNRYLKERTTYDWKLQKSEKKNGSREEKWERQRDREWERIGDIIQMNYFCKVNHRWFIIITDINTGMMNKPHMTNKKKCSKNHDYSSTLQNKTKRT